MGAWDGAQKTFHRWRMRKEKKKILALKVEESDYDGDMALVVKNFKIFMNNEKNKKE